MKIFLTGVTGQVGFELYNSLQKEHEVLAPNRQELDLNDFGALQFYLEEHKPELIINPAAWTAVDRAEESLEENARLNTKLPGMLAKYCQQHNIWMIHFSTDYVYPGTGTEPWVEGAETSPLNAYGVAKLAGEMLVSEICDKHIILRTSWVYSYRGSNFLNTMLRLGSERDKLSIVDDQIGAPTSAMFLDKMTNKMLDKILAGEGTAGTYNLCTSGACSWYEFAKEIFEQATRHGASLAIANGELSGIPTSAYPTPARRPLNSRMSLNKVEDYLDIKMLHWRKELLNVIDVLFIQANSVE